ncbi:Intramolecular chaperone auto-processing domain containing protein [uncultured Caudovirales phage]|uniref:Intramolecular chaperone auto-processing domain containing protein n=1 Tax=uncultured Caudovirales phage TaxID=2100421 RepID=A0A6J7X6F7_9CAUD|nr:Intramolecular chaperone auto-processing domain containing protein [uncultured Caudovirales phage]
MSTNRFNQDQAISDYQNKLRQQAIAEENMKRLSSLNEMNALLTGQQVNMPSMPQFNGAAASQPTQYLPAAQLTGQANLDAFNAQNQSANSFTSGLFGLGGSLGSAAMFAFSDSRLKRIIKRVGETQGIPLYLFKYLGSDTEHIGPIAQEVQKIRPDLVKRHQNGYLMVNYTQLMEA